MFLFDITLEFDAECRTQIGDNPEILHLIATHERREVVLHNLCRQVTIFETKYGGTKAQRQMLIGEVAKMFIAAAVQNAKDKNLSSAEASRIRHSGKTIGDLEEEVAEFALEVPRDA